MKLSQIRITKIRYVRVLRGLWIGVVYLNNGEVLFTSQMPTKKQARQEASIRLHFWLNAEPVWRYYAERGRI